MFRRGSDPRRIGEYTGSATLLRKVLLRGRRQFLKLPCGGVGRRMLEQRDREHDGALAVDDREARAVLAVAVRLMLSHALDARLRLGARRGDGHDPELP